MTIEYMERLLRTGAVFLGENHAHSRARDIASRLLIGGSVNQLYLEVMDAEVEPGLTAGQELRAYSDLRRRINAPVDLPNRAINYAAVTNRHGNPHRLDSLVRTALNFGIDVFYFDTAAGNQVGNDAMQARNTHMSRHILQHNLTNNCANVLVLAGNQHLDPNIGGSVMNELRIEPERYFNLTQPLPAAAAAGNLSDSGEYDM